jgi:hypothetical protein
VSGGGRGFVVAVALVVVAAGAAGIVWRCSGPAPVRPPERLEHGTVSSPLGAESSASAPGATETTSPTGAVREVVGGAARLRGRLLSSTGEPLPEFVVNLTAPGEPLFEVDAEPTSGMPRGRRTKRRHERRVTTDADGAFAFEALSPGKATLMLVASHWVTRDVTVRAGVDEFVEWRLPDDRVAVYGRLHRSGVPASDAWCDLHDGKRHSRWTSDRDGRIRAVERAGSYDVYVKTKGEHDEPEPLLATHHVVLPPGSDRFQFEWDVPGARLVVRVRTADGFAADPCSVELVRLPDEKLLLRTAGPGEGVHAPLVPPGRYRIEVGGAWILSPTPQELQVAAADRERTVDFTAVPAGLVVLEVVANDRGFVALRPEQLPPLVVAGGEVACADLRSMIGSGHSAEPGYRSVPLGPARLTCSDRQHGEEVAFLPFDPLPERTIDVFAGRRTDVRLFVERRAAVELLACDRSGFLDRSAKVVVYAGERRVQPYADSPAGGFRAHLPPGQYRVVIDGRDGVHERLVTVARADLRLRLRS